MWQWQAVIYVPLIQWSSGHFFAVCGFGSSGSLTSSCFFILFFYWLLVSSQKHEHNIVFQAYVQLCMIINNMNPVCTVTYMFLILSQLKNLIQTCTHQWVQKKFVKRMASFFFFWWRTVSFKEWPVIHHKKEKINRPLPPNSAVLLSLPAILKLLERYSAICALCALLPMFGKLTSLVSTFEWLKEMV